MEGKSRDASVSRPSGPRFYSVDLVERNPSIGGRMAQLDKTFPTMDCASCMMTPRW